MKNKFLLLALLFASSIIYAQNPTIIEQEWVNTYSYQDSIYNCATAIDANGNIIVTGYTYDAVTKSNITTIKYDNQGNEIWVKHYNGASNNNDRATGIIYDSNGNIYVCGFTSDGAININYILIKYDSNGNELWTQIYDNGGYDSPNDIAIDDNDNVYITGESYDAGHYDILTVKLDPNGNVQWLKRKDNGNNDYAKSIKIKNNRVFVGGYTYSSNNNYVLISYDLNGNEQYTVPVTTSNNDYAQAMTVDNNSNVYITGYTENSGVSEYLTVKFDVSGNILWQKQYKGYANWNKAFSVCTDNTGNIYITGTTIGTNINTISTLKYNTAGEQLWTQKHYTQAQMYKATARIVCDNTTGVYIGTTAGTNTNNDYCTIKYDFDGAEQWVQTYNGTGNGQDIVSDLTVDPQNNVYVTGQSYNGNNFDFATIKYSPRDVLFPPDNQYEPAGREFTYRQNKGQLKRIDNTPADEVKYYCTSTFPQYYIQDNKLSYVFTDIAQTTPLKSDSIMRVDMELLKARDLKVSAFEPVNTKLNYFFEHIPEGRVNINGYKRIVSPDIYNNIDLEYYSNEAGFKFYFVVYPGGDDTEITMKFNGADNVSVTPSGGLKIETRFGNIEYEKAWVYRINPGNNEVPMPTSGTFNVSQSGEVTIDINNYPSNHTLVIAITEDHAPAIINAQIGNLGWSTYHTDLNSSGMIDMGFDICTDNIGNIYTVGQTDRPNFPNYQGYYGHQGKTDAYLSKFDPITMHVFTTFYGGTEDDDAFSVAYNSVNDRIYFTGKVRSDDIVIWNSTNTNAYNQNMAYGSFNPPLTDAYIAKFRADNGWPIWTSYFSGVSSDAGRSITCDNNGDIYLTGHTSTASVGNNLPLAPTDGGFPIYNAIDNTYNGNQDIFYAKFNKDDQLQYSTYIGGSEKDKVFDNRVTSNSQFVYFVGGTESYNYPTQDDISSTNAFYTTQNYQNQGSCAYITCFHTIDGTLRWSTYFPRVKEFQSVAATSTKLVYATGITDEISTVQNSCQPETSGIPICNSTGNASVQQQNAGGNDLFIAKFQENELRWSTFYGGTTDEYSDFPEIAWDIDKYIASDIADNEHLYIAGLTQRLTGNEFPTLYNASYYYDDYNDGLNYWATDMFLLAYNEDNQLYWSTLFGGGDDTNPLNDGSNDIVGGLSVHEDKYFVLTGWTCTDNYPDADYDTGNPNDYYHPALNVNLWMPVSTVSAFEIIAGVGIEELENSKTGLNVYPNPAFDILYIDTDNKIETYTIYNNIGQQIETNSFSNNIDVSKLPVGMYLLIINTKENSYNIKFIKE